MNANTFNLDDFMAQLRQVRHLGRLGRIIGLIPGLSGLTKQLQMGEGDVERQMGRMQTVYDSMTAEERRDIELIGACRRHRIASGAGVDVIEVSQFVRQFEMSRNLMEQVRSMGMRQKLRVVMALVTNDPVHHDPSCVRPVLSTSFWWVLALLLGLLVIAVLWITMK